jgi:hypothetical protein
VSVDGRNAQVRFTAICGAIQFCDGIVYQNTVMFAGKAQFYDGHTGNVFGQRAGVRDEELPPQLRLQ